MLKLFDWMLGVDYTTTTLCNFREVVFQPCTNHKANSKKNILINYKNQYPNILRQYFIQNRYF